TKGKLIDALGVVSPYRLYFIKDGLTGLSVRLGSAASVALRSRPQVEKDIALLDMLEIGGYCTDNFTLRFPDKRDQPTISVSTGNAATLIQVLRTACVSAELSRPSPTAAQLPAGHGGHAGGPRPEGQRPAAQPHCAAAAACVRALCAEMRRAAL